MAARPVVTVFPTKEGGAKGEIAMPAVFLAPIRDDIVAFVHTNVAKNARQSYAVNRMAGHQTSAASWGTGRAVSRIPRVGGGGTSRSGQAAFGNMCRKGRMFAPTKVWRRWNRHVNVNQKRFAVVSALAASALPSLVLARGHRIMQVNEVPLVLSNDAASTTKTKDAVAILKLYGAFEDVERCKASRKIRTGKGKMRNRRHVQRRGPLVIYDNDEGISKAFRNLSGVECAQVDRLGLLQLAPGGHVGRFCVWTQAAFAKLDALYGSARRNASLKVDYHLPRNLMSNSDLARLINSDEIQSVVRPAKKGSALVSRKKNPLKNWNAMVKLNPAAAGIRRRALRAEKKAKADKIAHVEAKRAGKVAKTSAQVAKAAERAAGKKAFFEKTNDQPVHNETRFIVDSDEEAESADEDSE